MKKVNKPLRALNLKAVTSSGFTLIEILISMLILAIGIMGIAALQFKGLQYNQDAYFRTQINFLAYDIADRMRLNRANAAAYAMGTYTVNNEPGGCNQTGTGAVGQTNDIACWKHQLFESLPAGSTAKIVDGGGGLFTVTLEWVNREDPANPKKLDYTFQP